MGRGGSHGGRTQTGGQTSGFSARDRARVGQLQRTANNSRLSFNTRLRARADQYRIRLRYATGSQRQRLNDLLRQTEEALG
jgi:hypothetical protein